MFTNFLAWGGLLGLGGGLMRLGVSSSACYFHMEAMILADFQICIRLPLSRSATPIYHIYKSNNRASFHLW